VERRLVCVDIDFKPFSGWDVIAALVGLVDAALLQPQIGDYRILWLAVPAVYISMRRVLFPSASTSVLPNEPSGKRKAFGYLLMIAGGVVTLLAGMMFWIMINIDIPMRDLLSVSTVGGVACAGFWVACLGLQRVR
jgi:hypothetical protein